MKKRLLSLVLTLAMVLSFFPGMTITANAEESSEPTHSHDGWTLLTMDYLKNDAEKKTYQAGMSFADVGYVLPAGNYCLGGDIDLSDTSLEVEPPYSDRTYKGVLTTIHFNEGEVNLCLNGYTIKGWTGKESNMTVGYGGGTLAVGSGATLNLYDCSAEQTGKLSKGGDLTTDQNYGNLRGAAVHNDGIFNLYSGKIAGYSANEAGSKNSYGTTFNAFSIIVNNGAMNIYGGEISGNHTWDAPIIVNKGTLTMDGGNISENEVEVTGRNSYVTRSYGGAVHNNGTFTMTDGVIHHNGSFKGGSRVAGGGVYNVEGKTFTMTGGTISGNQARGDNGGGGVYNAGTFNMSGSAVISGNYATEASLLNGYENGGGGGVTNVSTFTMGAGAVISGNYSYGGEGGGGVYNKGTFIMTNAIISGNTSKNHVVDDVYSGDGGGLRNDGTATITGSYIMNNRIEWDSNQEREPGQGGGIYNEGELTLDDTAITGNSAIYGGGVYHQRVQTLTLSGDTYIYGNTNDYNGKSVAGNLTVSLSEVDAGDEIITVDNLGSDAKIGFTAGPISIFSTSPRERLDALKYSGFRTPVTFTTGAKAEDIDYFEMDHSGYYLLQYGDEAVGDETEHEGFAKNQLYLIAMEEEPSGKDPVPAGTIVIIGDETFVLTNGAAATDPDVTGIEGIRADENGYVIIALDDDVDLSSTSCGIFSANPIEITLADGASANEYSITSAAPVAVNSGSGVTINVGNKKLAVTGATQAISAAGGLTTEATVTDEAEDGNAIDPATANLSRYDELYFNYGAALILEAEEGNDYTYTTAADATVSYTLTAQSWNGAFNPTVTLDGKSDGVSYSDGTVTVNTTKLSAGAHTLSAAATDGAGKEYATEVTLTIAPKDLSATATVTFDPADKYYDGEEYADKIIVKDGTETLTVGSDYELSYPNGKINVGSTVTITFKGNYTGEKTVKLPILTPDLGGATGDAFRPSGFVVLKDGDNISLDAGSSIVYNGDTLDNDDYYLVSMGEIVEGTDKNTTDITIAFKGNYSGTKEIEGVTVKTRLTGSDFGVDNSNKQYTGSKHTPAVRDKTGKLVEGTDYEVLYGDNTQIGAAWVRVKGLGKYYTINEGVQWSFRIEKRNVNQSNIQLKGSPFIYTGSEIEPEFTIVIDGCVAPTADDYTVTYENNTDAGVGRIKFNFSNSNNYTGNFTKQFDIKAADLVVDNAFISGVSSNFAFVEGEFVSEIKYGGRTLTVGTDYTVESTDASAKTATIKFSKNYGNDTYELTDVAEKVRLTDAGFEINTTDKTYTGSEITTTVRHDTLREGNDYTVSYSANVNVGIATVTISGMGGYIGSFTKQFNITKAGQDAPAGLTATHETISGKNDGSISGVTDKMEYSADSGSSWTPITGTELTGLADGTYQIRYKEDDNHIAGTPAEVVINAGATLTVKFDLNYTTEEAIDDATGIDFNGKAVAPSNPTRAGYVFGGWYQTKDGKGKWDFNTDTVSDNMTLYAKWTEELGSVIVKVKDAAGSAVTDAEVGLLAKNNELYEHAEEGAGDYIFRNLPAGTYNVVVLTDGDNVVTFALVTVSAKTTTVTVTVPTGAKSSIVDNSGAGDFKALVGGLDKIAAADTSSSTDEVMITLTVTEEDNIANPNLAAEKTAIVNKAKEEVAEGKQLAFVDLSLTKSVNGGAGVDIGDNNNQLLEIIIPFDTYNKSKIAVYRYHDEDGTENDVQVLATSRNNDGEYIVVGADTITIHAKKFSTYAIGYTEGSGSDDNNGNNNGNNNGDNNGNNNSSNNSNNKPNNSRPSGGGSYVPPVKPAEPVSYDKCPKDETCPIHPYKDASASAWYHDGVHYCIEHGIMNGVSTTRFAPNGAVTRQQVWMVLARLSGETPANMAEARTWAMANGVSDGTNPTNAVTRQQFITMLYRYAVDKGYDVSVGEDTNILSYADAFSVSEYAIPAMQWGCGSGIMGGYSDGTLKPTDGATRAHLAAFLQRFCVNA